MPSHPYREGEPLAPVERDELAPATILHSRAKRTKQVGVLAGTTFGLVLGTAAYFALREVFFMVLGAHFPYLTGFVALAPPLTASIRLGLRVSAAVVRQRMPTWIRELSARYHVEPERLEEHALLALS